MDVMAEISFGVAFAECGLEGRQVAELLEIPGYDAAQLPADALDSKPVRESLKTLPLKSLHLGMLMDKAVSRNIATAPQGMRRGFHEQAGRILEKAAEAGISTASLDLSLETALGDLGLRDAALATARGLAPAMQRTGIAITLPFRIPQFASPNSLSMASFLRDGMLPGLKARLDIHPHELPKQCKPKELLKGLEFETRSVLFIYDADSGNRLVKGHIAPWVEILASAGFKGPFLLCPQTKSLQRLSSEIDSLSKFVRGMRNP